MAEKPDMDLLALAGLTKAGLRDIDQTSVGGTPHADKINIREMAGVDQQGRPQQGRPQQRRPQQGQTPNLLGNIDFIEAPKSRPMGQVSMEGEALPDRQIEFAPVTESLQGNIEHMLDHVTQDEAPVSPVLPNPTKETPIPTPEMDFDLFQFTMLKDILKVLDINISSVEKSLKDLKSKRKYMMKLIKGDKDA